MTRNAEETVRDPLLGEIETEIVGMQYHKAKLLPGEQINVEREAKNPNDRRAILVENGHFQPVGYLPRKMASWLAPLMDDGQIHLDGYVPKSLPEDEDSSRCPVVLSVFQREKGHGLLEKAAPENGLEALHQTVLQAYQNAQGYHNAELILGLPAFARAWPSRSLSSSREAGSVVRRVRILVPRGTRSTCRNRSGKGVPFQSP